MDRYLCIQAFLKVSDAQSLTKAAHALNISKSVVSERVSQLEELLGTKLLVRTTRKVSLTEIGAEVYPTYADLIARMGDIENRLQNREEGLAGRLRISSTIDAGISEVSEITSQFILENPQLNVELLVGNSFVNPQEDVFDVALHFRRNSSPHIIQQKLIDVPCGIIASRAYLENNPVLRRPQDLIHHNCVGYGFQASVGDWNTSEWVFGKGGKEVTIKVPLYARFNSGHALMTFIKDGHGIGVLPYLRWKEIGQAAGKNEIVEILTGYTAPTLQFYATYSKEMARTLKLQKYLHYLKSGLEAKSKALVPPAET